MTVREYIGARYVPLFADPIEWDSTKTYEPLTVVYYQGNSYTSRQAVPAGIELSNNTYWALTGNYNAQIEAYRAEVQTFDGRITENTDAIENIEGKFPLSTSNIANAAITWPKLGANVQSSIETLQGKFPVGTADVADAAISTPKLSTAIQTLLADLQAKTAKKHMVVIGDSFSTPAYSAEADMWYTAVKRQQNLTLHNYAVSGRGYIHPATVTTNFAAQVEQAAADTAFNNDDVRLVIIFGGLNDVSSFSGNNLYQACVDVLELAIGYFANAKIIVAGMNTFNTYTRTIFSMTLQLRQACIAQGVSFIDTSWLFFGSEFISENFNWHPNDAGQCEIAYMFNSALAGMPLVRDIYSDYDNSQGSVGTLRFYRNGYGVYAFGTMRTGDNGSCSMKFSNGIGNLIYQPVFLFNQNAAKPVVQATWDYNADTLSITNGTPNTSYTIAEMLKSF